MAENTAIEWCDHTFNPWTGCTKVSPGCDHCYAESWSKRAGDKVGKWGAGAQRVRTAPVNWSKPKKWHANAAAFMAEHGRRQRVFCASLADVFDNEVPTEWRIDLFKLIAATPDLDWLLLTKRIGNAKAMMDEVARAQPIPGRQADPDPLSWQPMDNVWIGATITSQAEADRDIPKLLAVPARVRFLSMEPLLGPIDLTRIPVGGGHGHHEFDPIISGNVLRRAVSSHPSVHWVIVGGESRQGARPMHPDWARSLRDQCADAGVPFLFKQWGEWTPGENVRRQIGTVATAHWFNSEWDYHKEDLSSTDNHVDDEPDLYRIGKQAAGRLLDGIEHNAFPTTQ